ncbi:MAG: D-alanyl-D-alanine carboxypeptidase/D-alanyl-D-alanine-endopeptidase, partial [Acidobacteriota bacterium]
VVMARITPGRRSGSPAQIETHPATSYLTIDNRILTVEAHEETDLQLIRLPGSNQVRLWGAIPLEREPLWHSIAVSDPPRYFLTVLKETLQAQGIKVGGGIRVLAPDPERAVGSPERAVGSWQLAVGSPARAVGSWQFAVGSPEQEPGIKNPESASGTSSLKPPAYSLQPSPSLQSPASSPVGSWQFAVGSPEAEPGTRNPVPGTSVTHSLTASQPHSLPSPSSLPSPLIVHHSPQLRAILKVLLKVSQNLYAETMVKTLAPTPRHKTYEDGRKRIIAMLTRMGIPPDSYILRDGSGLSRYNFLSADMLVRLLEAVWRHPERDEFLDFLPIAGVDGTLSSRMKGSAAEQNVRAKTGTLANVRALSGYVTTRDGETLAFAMIANNFNQPMRSAEYLQDSALHFLASLSRRE